MDKNRIEDRLAVWSWGGGRSWGSVCIEQNKKRRSAPPPHPPHPPRFAQRPIANVGEKIRVVMIRNRAGMYMSSVSRDLVANFGLLPFAPKCATYIPFVVPNRVRPTNQAKSIPENVNDQDRILPPPSLVQRKKKEDRSGGFRELGVEGPPWSRNNAS